MYSLHVGLGNKKQSVTLQSSFFLGVGEGREEEKFKLLQSRLLEENSAG